MCIIYHGDGTKTILDKKHRKSFEIDDRKPFHERIIRSYYDLECSHQLSPTHNKNWTKRVWERDAARKEAGIGD